MAKKDIINKISRSAHRVGFKLKKHSPEILAVAGTVGVVGSAVMACRATTKLSGILEATKDNVGQIEQYVEDNGYSKEYTEEDCKKDLTIVKVQGAMNVVKLYAPAVALGTLSLGCILASNHILRKRNIALAAAYATVDKGFKEYRGRVIERFGKELDRELKYNIKAKEVEEVVVNEDGTETTVKKTVNVAEIDPKSDYSRFFDETCTGWTKDAEYNLMFLKRQQDYANDLLRTRGHLYLNEVYDMLGMQRSKAGNIVGWIFDELHPNGDNYVDFGIYNDLTPNEERNAAIRRFVNGVERSILLDFNVDGNILDLMK